MKVLHNRSVSYYVRQTSQKMMKVIKSRQFVIFLCVNLLSETIIFSRYLVINFETTPNIVDFDFKQISFNLFKFPEEKPFHDDRDADLYYF